MAILQVHQAKALKDLDEGIPDPKLLQELRSANRLCSQSYEDYGAGPGSGDVHLAEMKDVEKVHFHDSPISQGSLFCDTVKDFAHQFSAIRKQMESIKHILSWRGSASRGGRTPR